MTKTRQIFSAEFKHESALLVVDQGYTFKEASQAMGVGLSTMGKWVKQLKDERRGIAPKGGALTPEQIEIKLKKNRLSTSKRKKTS